MRGIFAFLTLITFVVAAGCGGAAPGSGGGSGPTGGGSVGNGTTGGSGGNGSTGSTTTGAYGFKNASARALGNGDYTVTFLVDRALPTDGNWPQAVELLRLKWDGTTLDMPFDCSAQPWIDQRETSGVVTLDLEIGSSVGASLRLPCDPDNRQISSSEAVRLPSRSITLEADGILMDATPFSASVDIPIL